MMASGVWFREARTCPVHVNQKRERDDHDVCVHMDGGDLRRGGAVRVYRRNLTNARMLSDQR
jgi:hypothetical protein